MGEIEATLNQHPAVKECVIVACDRDSSEEKDLIGYFATTAPLRLTVVELRNFLKEKLPDYMVPSFFVQLEALPLTA